MILPLQQKCLQLWRPCAGPKVHEPTQGKSDEAQTSNSHMHAMHVDLL